LQTHHADFVRLGASLVAISPLLGEYSRQLAERHGLTFPLLRDPGNRVADLFGLRYEFPEALRKAYVAFGLELPQFNGDASWTLPMPARYVIDRAGIVRERSVSVDYRERPDIEETLAALRQL